jgi:lipoprotein-anchoring transpeptidase ErfK/SrfK
LLISYPIEAFGAYEQGKLVRWGPTSLGKKSTKTPTGLFFTNWKSKETISTEDSSWILKWYFNLVNSTGVSIHQYGLPGYPASHACARLYEEDAKWFL